MAGRVLRRPTEGILLIAMVYSLAIDARTIEECQSLGEAGVGLVAALLNSLDQNCLLIESRKSEFSCESLIKAVDIFADSLGNSGADIATRNRLKATLKKNANHQPDKTLPC